MEHIYTKNERRFALIISSLVLLPPFNFYLNNIMGRFNIQSVGVLLYFILIALELVGLYMVAKAKQFNKKGVAIATITAVMAFFSYLIYNEQLGERLIRNDFHPIYSELLYLFFFGLPTLLLASSFRHWNHVLHYITVASPVLVLMAFFAFWQVGFSTWGDNSMNYMTLSYHVLTAGCVCLSKSFKGVNVVYWISSLLFLFIIVAAGCRGALVCTLAFIVLLAYRQVIVFPQKRSSKIIFVVSVAAFVALPIVSVALFNNIIDSFDRLGISSRTIESVSDATFFESSARNYIRTVIWRGVQENPFGYGLYGDRYVCSKYYIGGAEYSHNVFYEFISDFGLFLGPLLLLIIIIRCYSFFKMHKKYEECTLFLLLIPAGFLKLFFSNSYLMEMMFFLLIGFLLSFSKKSSLSKMTNRNL